jgi:hypothetical protein
MMMVRAERRCPESLLIVAELDQFLLEAGKVTRKK